MRVLVTGASGLVGTALVSFLTENGHQAIRLVRTQPEPGAPEVQWNPAMGTIDAAGLEGLDAVVHLAGERLTGRWTPDKKARILESRVRGTCLLATTLASRRQPPRVLVSASAVGYYGDRGDEVLTEESAPGSDFLADVCRQWEEATRPAEEKGIRVVHLRSGVILSPEGGALAEMLPLFWLGLGGKLGNGKQWMSWIALEDAIRAIYFALTTEALRGAANSTAPNPVTNAEFTHTLGKVLARPTLLTAPAAALRLAFGEVATSLLASQRAVPARLLGAGFTFRYPDLEGALRHFLEKAAAPTGGKRRGVSAPAG